jgi:hypothetical protein
MKRIFDFNPVAFADPVRFPIFSYMAALVLAASLLPSCRQSAAPVKIGRLEQSLFTIPIDSIPASILRLEQQYGELFDLYSNRVICIGSPGNPGYPEELTRFLTDSYMNRAYKRVMEVYPNLNDLETGLEKAFSNYRKEFPERVIPSVYTLISGFNQQMITADTILAIALDNYLGKDEDMYLRMELASYQRYTMDRKYLVPDCMKAWIYTEFPYSDSIDNVLANILYEGKVMYAMHQLLPETPDSLLFGYTSDQVRWCRNNTARMWTFLVEKKMLYSTDYLIITKLTGPAPFCALFTRESPGRAAIWLGYRMITSYMEHNKVSLEALLRDNDYQQILAKAKFKP